MASLEVRKRNLGLPCYDSPLTRTNQILQELHQFLPRAASQGPNDLLLGLPPKDPTITLDYADKREPAATNHSQPSQPLWHHEDPCSRCYTFSF